MTSLTRTRSQGYMPAIVLKTIIIDRSGSMDSFNGKQYDMAEHLLQDSKKPAVDTRKTTEGTCVSFDYEAEDIMRDTDLLVNDVPSRQKLVEALQPRGCTRFNDTLIEEVERLVTKKEKYLEALSTSAKKLNPDVAMVVIAITDGQDNESKASTAETREIMIRFRKNGGRAILMAANMDAETIGAWYGFNPEKAITVHNSDEQAIESCYRAVSNMTRNMTQGIDMPFTQLERANSSPQYSTTPTQVQFSPSLSPPPLTRQRN
jgi:hypothetical protein